MKYDMAGGATMIGVMRALAALKPNVKVICVVPVHGKHAGRQRAEARRHSDRHVRQDDRGAEYRRRRPADSGRWRSLREATRRDASCGCGDAHRRDCRGAGERQRRRVQRRRSGVDRQSSRFRESGRRKNVANADGRRVPRIHQEHGSPTFKTSAAAKAAARLRARGSSANSPATRRGSIWTSRARPGTTTPSRGLRKGPTGVAVRTLVHLAMSY